MPQLQVVTCNPIGRFIRWLRFFISYQSYEKKIWASKITLWVYDLTDIISPHVLLLEIKLIPVQSIKIVTHYLVITRLFSKVSKSFPQCTHLRYQVPKIKDYLLKDFTLYEISAMLSIKGRQIKLTTFNCFAPPPVVNVLH